MGVRILTDNRGGGHAEHGLDTMPLYLREGAVIPMGPVVQWVGERPADVSIGYEARAGRHQVRVEGHADEVVLDAPAGVELRR